MNRTLAAYLANVATAAEVAPFGTPGIFQMNAFMNNALVWAANSVASAQRAFDIEPTEANDDKMKQATVRLHTIAAIYHSYAEDVAIPKLELPHVERFMGLDREPDVTEIELQATNAAKLAVRNALLAGRNPKGVYAKAYAQKTVAMAKVREERREQLAMVYGLVHIEPDSDLYDEAAVQNFIDNLHDKCMSIARANWMYACNALTDVSLRTFNPEKYQRLTAVQLGTRAFMAEFGISDAALTEWRAHLDRFVAAEQAEFAGTEAELTAACDAEAAAHAAEQAELVAKEKASKVLNVVKSDARLQREAEERNRLSAIAEEEAAAKAKKAAAKAKREAKKAAAATI